LKKNDRPIFATRFVIRKGASTRLRRTSNRDKSEAVCGSILNIVWRPPERYLQVGFCGSAEVERGTVEVELTGQFEHPRNTAGHFRLVALL